jgi:hypothetical protein
LSESRFPDLLETLVVKVCSGIIGLEPRALQAGGRRFDPGHVHQSVGNLSEASGFFWFFFCTTVENHALLEIGGRSLQGKTSPHVVKRVLATRADFVRDVFPRCIPDWHGFHFSRGLR